jgi:hypothetical protein
MLAFETSHMHAPAIFFNMCGTLWAFLRVVIHPVCS